MTRPHRAWRAAAATAAAVLLLSACGQDSDGGNGDQGGQQGDGQQQQGGGAAFKLGYVLPETGQLRFLGPPQIQAAKYAIDQINQAGGVLGKNIPPMVSSDESDQQSVAVQSAERVLNANVNAIIGAAASDKSLAIIDKVTGAGVAQCSGSNTAPTFTDYNDNGLYFRTAPSDALQGPVLANTILQDGHSNVALLARADDYGRGLMEATANALEESGATVSLRETYDPEAQDFASPVQAAVDTNSDAVVVIAFEEGSQIIKGLLEAGLSADQLYGADGLRSEDLGNLVNKADPSVIAGLKGTAPASAENEQFVNNLKQFAPNLKELQFAPQVFDCVNILALAAEAAGSTDAAQFKSEVVGITKDGQKCGSFSECKDLLGQGEDIDYQGASGPLDFIEAGEPGSASIEVYTYNQQGQLETLRTQQISVN